MALCLSPEVCRWWFPQKLPVVELVKYGGQCQGWCVQVL